MDNTAQRADVCGPHGSGPGAMAVPSGSARQAFEHAAPPLAIFHGLRDDPEAIGWTRMSRNEGPRLPAAQAEALGLGLAPVGRAWSTYAAGFRPQV